VWQIPPGTPCITVCWLTGNLVPSLLTPNLNYTSRTLLLLLSQTQLLETSASTTVVKPKYLFKSSGPLQLYPHATFYIVSFLTPHPTPKLHHHPFLYTISYSTCLQLHPKSGYLLIHPWPQNKPCNGNK
jgi:hypothetical protein